MNINIQHAKCFEANRNYKRQWLRVDTQIVRHLPPSTNSSLKVKVIMLNIDKVQDDLEVWNYQHFQVITYDKKNRELSYAYVSLRIRPLSAFGYIRELLYAYFSLRIRLRSVFRYIANAIAAWFHSD